MTHSKLLAKLLFLACALFVYSCDVILPANPKSDSWYRTYSGKIGGNEMVLHLTKTSNYNGYIWFKDTQYPVMVFSDPTVKPAGDSIYLDGGKPNLWISLKGVIKETITGEMSIQINNVQDPTENVILSRDDSFTKFDFISTKESAQLPEKLKNKSTYEYFMGTVVPKEDDFLGEALKVHIKELLGMPASSTNIPQWMDSTQISSLDKWKTKSEKLTAEDAETIGMSLSEQIHNQLTVMYENDDIITLANYVYLYTGGAHGNYSTNLVNVDKATGKKRSLTDLLSSEGIKALPDLLDKAARKQYQITDTEPLEDNGFFVNTLQPGENFYITSKGIGFYYSPYEIKPYSDGEINLFIPKESLQAYWIK